MTSGAVTSSRDAASISVQRTELLQLLVGAVAHELGNLTSPVGLVAATLDGDLSPAQRTAASRILRQVAGGMRDLIAVARVIRGGVPSARFAPPQLRQLDRWWNVVRPLLLDLVPSGCAVECAAPSAPVSAATLEPLTWVVASLTRGAGIAQAQRRTIALALQPDETKGVLRVAMTIDGITGSSASTDVQPWLRLARAEVRRSGGHFRQEHSARGVTWIALLPNVEAQTP